MTQFAGEYRFKQYDRFLYRLGNPNVRLYDEALSSEGRPDIGFSRWQIQPGTVAGTYRLLLYDRHLYRVGNSDVHLYDESLNNEGRPDVGFSNWNIEPGTKPDTFRLKQYDRHLYRVGNSDVHLYDESLNNEGRPDVGFSNWNIIAPVALTAEELRTAIETCGPCVIFHPDDKFRMCSVDWFLQHCTLHDDVLKTDIRVSQLPHGLPTDGNKDDKRYWLILDKGAEGGDQSTAKAYVRAFWKPGLAYTDLQFWMPYAYNGPGTGHVALHIAGAVAHEGDVDTSPLGAHFGDWECCMVRVDNDSKQVVGVYLSQHDGGRSFGSNELGQFGKVSLPAGSKERLFFFSSRNGHAGYPQAGTNNTERREFSLPGAMFSALSKIPGIGKYLPNVLSSLLGAGGIPGVSSIPGLGGGGGSLSDFLVPVSIEGSLVNACSGSVPGPASSYLDCSKQYEIISAEWLGDNFPEPVWVNYKYRWGPENTQTEARPDMADRIVRALAGDGAQLVTKGVVDAIAVYLVGYFTDDLNGPVGPKCKKTWNATYE